ncbi:HTH-type transcriptional regulator CdhR [compost metagenome]
MSHFERAPLAVELLIQEYFDLLAFARTMESLRLANQLAGRALFRWSTLSRDSAPVRASNGMRITPDGALSATPTADLLILCDATGSRPADHAQGENILEALLRLIARHDGEALAGEVSTALMQGQAVQLH